MEEHLQKLLQLDQVKVQSILSYIVALIYSLYGTMCLVVIFKKFKKRAAIMDETFINTIYFLAIGSTAIFISLQNSLALSIGLIGSLSIIRFRTPIKDPLQMALIFLTIAISLLSVIGNIFFILVFIGFVVMALFLNGENSIFNFFKNNNLHSGKVVVSIDKTKNIKDFFGEEQAKFLQVESIDSGFEELSVVTFKFSNLELTTIEDLKSQFEDKAKNVSFYMY